MRVAILGLDTSLGATVKQGDEEQPIIDKPGVLAAFEEGLLKKNITVVDNAEAQSILTHLNEAKETGVHTVATTIQEYQPAATHGVFIKIQENISLLTALSFGLLPRSVDMTARVIDVRTGEVSAAAHSSAYGSVYSSRAAYKAARRLAEGVADALAEIQENGRHLRPKDWPSNFQQDSSDPSAQGRYQHAGYMAMMGFHDQALEALREAIRLNPSYAEKARSSWEFESFREDDQFKAIVSK